MRIRERGWAGLFCSALAVLGAASAPAQDVGSDRELRRALEESFEVLVLRDGVLLQPLDPDASPRSIEVGPEGIFLDGTPAGEDELAARLGEETAELVSRLAGREPDDLRRLAAEPLEEESAAEDDALLDEIEEARDEAIEAARESRDEARRRAREEAEEARERAREELERVRERRVQRDTQVVVASSHTVEEDEVSEDVLVMGGSLRVHGRVVGDAVALGGTVRITGEVTGDVAAIGGSVYLEPEARVGGEVVSVGGRVHREPGAEVDGRIEEVPFRWRISGTPWDDDWFDGDDYGFDFSPWSHWMRVGWRLFWVLFVALLAAITLLVARRPVERMERRIEREPWKAGLIGLLAQLLFLPVLILVVVVLAISIIGIPVLLLVPFALVAIALAAFAGFVATARVVGRWLERRFGRDLGGPYAEALVGLGMIYIFSLVGHLLNSGPMPLRFIAVMSLVLGTLVWYAAWTVGFGASILTRFGTADSWERGPGREPVPPVPDVPEPGPGAAEEEWPAEEWSAEEETELEGAETEEWPPPEEDEPRS